MTALAAIGACGGFLSFYVGQTLVRPAHVHTAIVSAKPSPAAQLPAAGSRPSAFAVFTATPVAHDRGSSPLPVRWTHRRSRTRWRRHAPTGDARPQAYAEDAAVTKRLNETALAQTQAQP